jgi:DNA-binding transcriptional LysR family regulator
MVLSGQAEIGLARSLNHPEIETLSLRDDPLLLVAHPNHSPKGIRKARLEEVANWPLIFYERGSSDWTLTHSLFRRAGLLPNVALEVDTIETAKRMVERELGMAFLPQLAVVNEIRAGKLCTLQIPDEGTLRRSLDAIHPRHRPLRPEALAFLKVVQDAANESSAITRKSRRVPVKQRKK